MNPEKALEKALNVMEVFRRIDPDVGVQTIAVFLLVAQEPGVTVSGVVAKLGLTLSSASRNVSALSTRRKGLGLLDYHQDMSDFRRRELRLTPAGARLVSHVQNALS